MRITTIDPADTALMDRLLELNNEAVPAVGELDAGRLVRLVEISTTALVARDDQGAVAGFCLVLDPDTDYTSVNYRWFCDRYANFAYLDRVVVAPDHRGRGVGRALYDQVDAEAREAGHAWFCLEVNLRPRNDESLAFHDRLGFVEVGQQETDYGSLVSMQARELS